MSNKNYYHIHYINCPHFTVGHVDQWGEQGYLFYEGMVYEYDEDRKCQTGSTFNPRSVEDFINFAKENDITIPPAFLKVLEEDA